MSCVLEYSDEAIRFALKRVRYVWRESRRDHDRFSVYRYLEAVYELGMIWKIEEAAQERAQRALHICDIDDNITDPFAVIIRCTSPKRRVEGKTRSKWSRVMNFASNTKKPSQSLTAFIKRQGGINKAASVFAERLKERGSQARL